MTKAKWVAKKIQEKNMFHHKRRFLSKLHVDWPLLMGIMLVSILGIIILYSAKPDMIVIQKQGLRLILACGVMIAIAQVPPRIFKSITPGLYGFALILLISVLIIGHVSKGGQRWLDLWLFRFQPAELMKIAVPLMIAKYFDDRVLPPKIHMLIIPLLLVLIPAGLIAKQPDLGTALLILSSGLLVIFFSGVSWRVLFSLASLITLCLPTLWFFMRDYQRQRILVLLDPERDPLGSGYQIIQSKIAIGSGGLYGKGWLNGTQSNLEFLPERTTDFIFAVFSEEFGLVGCLILLLLYLCIIIRGLYISVQAQNTFARLLAGSLIMTLFVYVFVNIGMVTGILPVVGIPLPLISYGGTSLVTLMASFGILMSIHTHRTLLAK
jgi:rod shape determining protein RodA